MRKFFWSAVLGVLFSLIYIPAQAQQADVGIGFGTLVAPSASSVSDSSHSPESIRGGLYPSVRADIFMKKHFGFNGEVAWRARQNLYTTSFAAVPFRPILYDFNALLGSRFSKEFGADAMAGIGGEDLRFYTPYYNGNCAFSCTNYVSSTHFLVHGGADVRFYVHGNFFIRPEAHFYYIRNNNEFSSNRVTRFTISLGYSFFSQQ